MLHRSLSSRLVAIDALRGFVMLLMLLDHVRETIYLHMQVGDPMDVTTTAPALFISRTLAHFCAPVFIFLTGLSAALYYQKNQSLQQTAGFLFKRGLVLIILEMTLINFAWTFQFPPSVVYLQVIWAIGLSMVVLSALIFLPRPVLLALSIVMIAGHNLLNDVHFTAESIWSVPWAILHDRGWLEVSDTLRMRTSYPLIPWPGVMALGFLAAHFYQPSFTANQRQRIWLSAATLLFVVFAVLRLINGYGEHPWSADSNVSETLMSIFNITKYPPSLLFICLTLGAGFAMLALFEKQRPVLLPLADFGAAPMFFYLLHLYVLKIIYLAVVAIRGTNKGTFFGVDSMWQVWLVTIVLAFVLFRPVQAFAQFKNRRRDIRWLKYF